MRDIVAKIVYFLLQLVKLVGLVLTAHRLRQSRLFHNEEDAPHLDRILWYLLAVDVVGFIEMTFYIANLYLEKMIIWKMSLYANAALATKLIIASILLPEIERSFTITGSVICFLALVVCQYISDSMKVVQEREVIINEMSPLVPA